jgi:ectonucleotide pyrophosphatase/phosphodiesterase family protein 5
MFLFIVYQFGLSFLFQGKEFYIFDMIKFSTLKKMNTKKFFPVLAFLLLISAVLLPSRTTVIISLDGFRWDYLDRGLTPNMDSVAEGGVRASSLKCVFPTKTFPNHISAMTGLYPAHHGIIANSFVNPVTGEKYGMKAPAVRQSKWYEGEFFWEYAKKHGVTTASYFWPGSECYEDYRRPHFYHQYDHDRPYTERIKGVLDWISLPDSISPDFVTLYFHETDSKGHGYGVDSDSLNYGIALVDTLVGKFFAGLDSLGIKDSVNVIILSDHGMADISEERTRAMDEIIADTNAFVQNWGTFMMIHAGENRNDIYKRLKASEQNYTAYLKSEIPERLHYRHPFVGDIVVIAENGWILKYGESSYNAVATHGWDNEWMDMHGIFLAHGPDFKKGFRTGTLNNIDLFPLLCEIFGFEQKELIDGKIERIGHILAR